MSRAFHLTLAGAALTALSWGCSTDRPASPANAQPATKDVTKAASEAPKKAAEPPARVKKPAPKVEAKTTTKAAGHGHRGGKPDIKWAGPVKWQSWEEGLAEAKASKKPICLVVYADWCPRCRELAPFFADDQELVGLSEKVVMIRQDSDQKPAWLTEGFGKYGGYVPRVFMLGPGGEVREDLTSGHPRYPYFYTPSAEVGVKTLKANLQKLISG